jgi:2-dehydro-3-deoxyphosphogluconate aldolase / (4S)-4-hydroxy-2-oxoglutarate aldolase
MAWIPGVMTTTEIYQAQSLGADIIKVFPANVLGTAFIKGVKRPMSRVKLLVTGGIEPKGDNLQSWFDSGVFAVGLGSQLFPKSAIESANYSQIQLLVRNSIDFVLKNCLGNR